MKKSLLLLVILFSSITNAQSLEDIQWITEIYSPSNFVDKQGKLKGYTVDILMKIWKKVGLKKTRKDIKVIPWARGLMMLEEDKTVCLFGMGISNDRKKKFNFLGRAPGNIRALIAKKEKKFKFNKIDEVNQKIGRKKIGAVRGDIGGNTFLKIGGKPQLLHLVVRGNQLVKMLDIDRFDLIAFADTPTFASMREAGIAFLNYEIVLPMSTSYWGYAFNKNVNQKTLKTLQKAYDELFEDGTIMRIRNAYVNNMIN